MASQTAPFSAAGTSVEKLTVFFTVLSPIHIGTRDGVLLPMEYLFDGAQVHVVDESKLGAFLMQRNLMDIFVQHAFSGDLGKKGLQGFLKEKARDTDFKKVGPQVASYSVPGGASNIGEFRPFVRDGFGRVYLPGTSIKGVLRTAFLYHLLKRERAQAATGSGHPREHTVRGWIQNLKNEKNKERAKKFLSESLQKTHLQSWQLPGGGKEQNRDILRCLKVRDAYPMNAKVETKVIPIRFLSKKADGTHYWSKSKKGMGDLVVWLEAVIRGTFQTEILWDHDLWRTFVKANPRLNQEKMSPKKILVMADAMNQDLIAHEKAFFTHKGTADGGLVKQWYEKAGESLFRIGFGSGMLSTTVNLLWSEQLRQEIRNVCGHLGGTDPAPKSRRVWVKNDREYLPMGWARILIAKQDKTGQEDDHPSPVPEPPTAPPRSQTPEGVPPKKTPNAAAPKTDTAPPVPPQPTGSEKPGEKTAPGLMDKARDVSLTNKLAMERFLEELDAADTLQARKAAKILKERMIKQKLWKHSPFQTSIEEILADEDS